MKLANPSTHSKNDEVGAAWSGARQPAQVLHASDIAGFFDLVREHNDDLVLFAFLYAQLLESGGNDALRQAYVHYSAIAAHVLPFDFCRALCKEFQAKRAMIIKNNDRMVFSFEPAGTIH